MRVRIFALRNWKEMVRDPLTVFFGIAFPLVLLGLLSAIQANIPISMFEINALAPGIAVFGLSFMALFAGLLIAKDRTSALTQRLFASPMKKWEFIAGYALPMIPMAVLQSLLCLLAGGLLGMELRRLPLILIVLLPASMVFIALGLLAGSLFNDKQVGGICGALLTNLSAWFSGIWFDVSLVGGIFEGIAEALPFSHAVKAAQAAAAGNIASAGDHIAIVCAYAAILFILAVWVFRRKNA